MIPRFRAIDPETGKTSEPFGFDIIHHYLSGGEPKKVHLQYVGEAVFKRFPKDFGALILSQSTGLTDASGTEVFDGDVLAAKDPSHPLAVVMWAKDSYVLHRLNETDTRIASLGGTISGWLEVYQVIGSRYQSQSALEQRAREVQQNA